MVELVPAPSSSSAKKFQVPLETAMQSEVIAHCLEDAADAEAPVIPLPIVDEDTLALVLEFMNILVTKAEEGKEEEERKKRFFDDLWKTSGMTTVYAVLNAGLYMNIQKLRSTGCQWIADHMTGMTTEQMRETFGFVDDFTPEEKQRVTEENAWAYS